MGICYLCVTNQKTSAMKKIKYPVGIQTFSEIREGGYLYVDKTAEIFKLFDGKYYFLSRPRRFGKSLMLTTLKAYYDGRRDLFKGLALDSLTDEWEPRPVFHLDLNTGDYDSPEGLLKVLNNLLGEWEEKYGLHGADLTPSIRFRNVIKSAFELTGKRVAILIDEYDKPMLNAFGNEKLVSEFRSILKALYSNLKTMDAYIEIAVLTGVARFSKLSIFSDLNNLRDISFNKEFAAICGITSDELDQYFDDGIEKLAETYGKTSGEMREELRTKYDGYHFADVSPDIYNPYSIVKACADSSLESFWFREGTPTYLVRLIEKADLPIATAFPYEIDAEELRSAGILSHDPIPVLYQTGYLTIKGYDRDYDTYLLDYPNQEVKQGFLKFLVPYYLSKREAGVNTFSTSKFLREVNEGRIKDFMLSFKSLIAHVPYSEKGTSEDHFRTAIYLLFTLMGFFTKMEDRTSRGSIDLTVETPGYVYLFEFKIDKSARVAMDQIRERRYWEKFLASGKKIYLIGANFNTKTRTLNDYLIEEA